MLQQVDQTAARDLEWSCQGVSPWMSPAILTQLSIAVSVGGGSALSMLRMKAGTPAFSSQAKKAAKPDALVDVQSLLKGLMTEDIQARLEARARIDIKNLYNRE